MGSYNRIVESLIKHPRYAYRDSFLEGLSLTDFGLVAAFNVDLIYSQQGVGRLRLKTTILTKISEQEAVGYDSKAYQRHFPRPEGSRNCLVYLHSHHGCRAEGTYLVKFLSQFNASLVLFDFAGAGESEGQFTSFGWFEGEQASTVIGQLVSTFKFERIGVWGKSMGACAALRYRTLALHPQVCFLVIDSSFDKLKHALISIAKEHSKAPTFAIKTFMYFLSKTVQDKAHFDVYKVRPIDWVPAIQDIPIVFVKGEVDKLVTYEEFKSLYTGCRSSIKHLEITKGSHAGNRIEEDSKFREFITGFVAKFFPPVRHLQTLGSLGQSAARFAQFAGSVWAKQSANQKVAQFHQSNFEQFNNSMHPGTGLMLPVDDGESPTTTTPLQPAPIWQSQYSESPTLTRSNQFASPIPTKPKSITLQGPALTQPSIPQPMGSPRFNGGLLAGVGFASPNFRPKSNTDLSKPLRPPPPKSTAIQRNPIFESYNSPGKSLTKQVTQLDSKFAFTSMIEQPMSPTLDTDMQATTGFHQENHYQQAYDSKPPNPVLQPQTNSRFTFPQNQTSFEPPASHPQPSHQAWHTQAPVQPQQQQVYDYEPPAYPVPAAQSGQQYFQPSRSSAPAQLNYFSQNHTYSQNQQDIQPAQWPVEQQFEYYQPDAAAYTGNPQQPLAYPTDQQQIHREQTNPYISLVPNKRNPQLQRPLKMTDSMGDYFNR